MDNTEDVRRPESAVTPRGKSRYSVVRERDIGGDDVSLCSRYASFRYQPSPSV